MMANAMSARGQSQGGDGERAIREKRRRLIEEGKAVRLAGGAG